MTDVMHYRLSHKLDVRGAKLALPEGHPSKIASTIAPVPPPATTGLLAKKKSRLG